MDVAALCPFEVGVLRWQAPTPALTVVVKATWSLPTTGAHGVVQLASRQDPLSCDVLAPPRAGDGAHSEEVAWASDFVPYKPRADVLLLGHARAAAPASVIAVRILVDEVDAARLGPAPARPATLDRLVYAASPEPTLEVPLSPSFLRVSPRPDARATGVGPSPTWTARPLLGGAQPSALIGPSGVPRGVVGPDFDLGLFNVAPAEQQVRILRGDERVLLEGVGPRGARIEARLPGVRPRVFLADAAGGPTQELAIALDTLAIDVDRSVCVTVWRGAVVLEAARKEPALVVVAAEGRGDSLDWPTVLGSIFTARCVRAAEPTPELATGAGKDALPRLYDDDDDSMPTVGRWSDDATTRPRDLVPAPKPSSPARIDDAETVAPRGKRPR